MLTNETHHIFRGELALVLAVIINSFGVVLGYTGALKAPVRCFGNHLSEKRESLFQTR